MCMKDVEQLLDGDFMEEDNNCEDFLQDCEEYLLNYIDFYTFVTIVEPHKILTCLDDHLFTKLIRKFAEEGIILETFYELENAYSLSIEKLKFAKFMTAAKSLAYSESVTYADLENLLREYCFTYYHSLLNAEERQNFVNNFAILLNVAETKKGV